MSDQWGAVCPSPLCETKRFCFCTSQRPSVYLIKMCSLVTLVMMVLPKMKWFNSLIATKYHWDQELKITQKVGIYTDLKKKKKRQLDNWQPKSFIRKKSVFFQNLRTFFRVWKCKTTSSCGEKVGYFFWG